MAQFLDFYGKDLREDNVHSAQIEAYLGLAVRKSPKTLFLLTLVFLSVAQGQHSHEKRDAYKLHTMAMLCR